MPGLGLGFFKISNSNVDMTITGYLKKRKPALGLTI